MVWGAAGWFLADPYATLAAEGTGPLLLAALTGAAVGAVGSLGCALGGGGAMLLHGVGPLTILWWWGPLVLVLGALGAARIAPALRARRGPAGVTGLVAAAAVAVPVAVWAHRSGEVAGLLPCLLPVCGLHLDFLRRARALGRHRRAETHLSMIAWPLFLLLLALSPVGASAAALWRDRLPSVPLGAAFLLVAGVALTTLLKGCTRLAERAPPVRGPLAGRYRQVFSSAYGLTAGLPLFAFTAGAAHRQEELVLAAALGVPVWMVLGGPLGRAFTCLHRAEAALQVRYDEGAVDTARRTWAQDTARRRGAGPPPLVVALLDNAGRAAAGASVPPPVSHLEPFDGDDTHPVELALGWIDEAELLLELLRGKTPPGRAAAGEGTDRAHDLHRVACARLRGAAYRLHGYPEDAERALREAAGLCGAAGLVNLRALFTLEAHAAGPRAPETAAELAETLETDGLFPAVRRRVATALARDLHGRGERAALNDLLWRTAEALGPRAGSPRPGPGEETFHARGTVGRVSCGRMSVTFPVRPEERRLFETGAAALADRPPAGGARGLPVGLLDGAVDLPERHRITRGLALVSRGLPGAVTMEKAARGLRRRRLDALAMEVWTELGFSAVSPHSRLRFFEEALAIGNAIRAGLLSGDHRLGVLAGTEPPYEPMVELLAGQGAGSAGAGGGTGGHPHPVRAFDLVQEARARALTGALGERVPRPALPRLAEAVAASRRLREAGDAEVAEAHAALARTWEEITRSCAGARTLGLVRLFCAEILTEDEYHRASRGLRSGHGRAAAFRARRRARRDLERLWDELGRQGGEAAEYVALRRGTPATHAEVRHLLR
ncbi:hypothetical protein GCM10017673_20940 [Streptosporangium violaceochromogenes]|nr:hypothetical protein GCM10017673_20940 [Streptosporangium violaceochromogenes]